MQMEEHVICHCPLSDHVQSQFGAVSFYNIAKFCDCAEVDVVCRMCHLILSIYDWNSFSLFFLCSFELCLVIVILWDCTFIIVCCTYATWQQCVLFVLLLAVFISVNKIYCYYGHRIGTFCRKQIFHNIAYFSNCGESLKFISYMWI